MQRTKGCILFGCLAAMLISPRIVEAGNGGGGTILDDPPIAVDADWYTTSIDTPPAFYWPGGDDALNLEGPYTFNALGPVRLDITDDFFTGDRFEVFDFGSSIGFTSLVPNAGSPEIGPSAAFLDPAYSSGSFFLSAGAHSITIVAIENPYDGGRGYLRVVSIPEPHVLGLVAIGLTTLLAGGRRRVEAS